MWTGGRIFELAEIDILPYEGPLDGDYSFTISYDKRATRYAKSTVRINLRLVRTSIKCAVNVWAEDVPA